MSDSTNNTPENRHSLSLLLTLRSEVRTIEQLMDRELAQWHGVSLEDFVLLLQLFDAPDCRLTRSELSAQLGERITELVKRIRPLQRIGLITDDDGETKDLRALPVALSEAGSTFVNDCLVTANDVAAGALFASRRKKAFDPLRELIDPQ